MRTIDELLNNNAAVWFYCESEEIGKKFLQDAENEGYTFVNGTKPTENGWGHILVPHKDKTIAYLSLMIWTMAFSQQFTTDSRTKRRVKLIKIEYKKYINGEEDYICKEPYFTRYMLI